MWLQDCEKMEEIKQAYGSSFAAIIGISKLVRKLRTMNHGVILESTAIKWVLSGIPPKDLEYRLKVHQQQQYMQRDDKVNLILDSIESEEIRNAVRNSYKLSMKFNTLMYDYQTISDKSMQARIRILTRMTFLASTNFNI